MNIILRKATVDDGEILLKWRNDPAIYQYYHNPEPVVREDHFRWFHGSLQNPKREIYIVEVKGVPVGMVRFDVDDVGHTELSWAVDPTQQRRGIGTAMLQEARRIHVGELSAEIKVGNIGSVKIAEAAGFTKESEQDGTMFYRSLGR